MTMTLQERLDNLDAVIREDRLIRNKWRESDHIGAERVCLLVAMFPEVTNDVYQCPAGYLPEWLVRCVPDIDDYGSRAAWPAMVRRFAITIRRSASLTPDQWERVRLRWMYRVLGGLPVTSSQPIVDRTRSLLSESESREVTADEWAAARAAARAAALAAAYVDAARAAARAARNAAGASLTAAIDAREATWDANTTHILDVIDEIVAESALTG